MICNYEFAGQTHRVVKAQHTEQVVQNFKVQVMVSLVIRYSHDNMPQETWGNHLLLSDYSAIAMVVGFLSCHSLCVQLE